jgi:hypothetical protein
VDAEVLSALFNSQIQQLTGANAYNRLPFLAPGDELVKGAEADLLSLRLDPSLELGADTVALSEHGVVQKPLELVKENKVSATALDAQYGAYLGKAPGTSRGSVVVEAGKMAADELRKAEPLVLEILQFSGLFTDAASGTFSSEIRLALLHDRQRGTVKTVKGGSISGSFQDNFRRARLSKERVRRAHFESGSTRGSGYFGPEFALLSDVSVVS